MGCNKCSSAKCTCGCISSKPATGCYPTVPSCLEDHTQYVNNAQFYFSICPTTAWNVPLCGGSAVLSIPGISGVAVGSYIWADTFGYFEITAVDTVKETITVTNSCTEGNANSGTQIPACTCFVVTVPPQDIDVLTGVCVAVSFTAPEEGVPTDITLTSTDGVSEADTIQIGTGFYFVEAVKPNNIITIINQGEGIIPGTPVIAQDVNGNYLYCLSIVATNPCSRTPISSGTLLACDEEGVTAPLGSPCEEGYIPVAIGDCEVEMQPALVPPVCDHLTAAVNIVNADATYSFPVADNTQYVVGDIVTVAGMPGTRGEVTSTPGSSINVTLTPTPSANQTLPIGTLICTISCCEELANRVDVLECAPVQFAYNIAGTAYLNIATGFVGGVWEYLIDSTLGSSPYTTPISGCSGNVWAVEAFIEFAAILPHTSDLVGQEAIAWFNEIQGYINEYPVNGRARDAWYSFSNDLYSGLPVPPGYPAFTLFPDLVSVMESCPGSTVDGVYKSLAHHAGHIHVAASQNLPDNTPFNISLVFRAMQNDSSLPPDASGPLSVWAGGTVLIRRRQ